MLPRHNPLPFRLGHVVLSAALAVLLTNLVVQEVRAAYGSGILFNQPVPPTHFILVAVAPNFPGSTSVADGDVSGRVGCCIFTAPFNLQGMSIGPDGFAYILTANGLLGSIGGTVPQIPGTPVGFTFGPDGNLYVGDSTSGFIYRFCGPLGPNCPPGAPFGATSGLNKQPPGSALFVTKSVIVTGSSLVFGPDGDLYVTSGALVLRFCGPGKNCDEGTPQPSVNGDPSNVAAYTATISDVPLVDLAFGPDNNLYVLASAQNEAGNPSAAGNPASRAVLKFVGPGSPNEGKPQSQFVQANVNQPLGATSMDFGSDGNLYVTGSKGISRYYGPNCSTAPVCNGNPAGNNTFGTSAIFNEIVGLGFLRFNHFAGTAPISLALLVSDAEGIKRFDPFTGNPLPGRFPNTGAEFTAASTVSAIAPLFAAPGGLAFGPDGNLYIADPFDNDILIVNGSTGQPLANRSSIFFSDTHSLEPNASLIFNPGGDTLLFVDQLGSGPDADLGVPLNWPAGTPGGSDSTGPGGSPLQGMRFGPDQALYVVNGATIYRSDDVNPFNPQITVFVSDPIHLPCPRDLAFSPVDQDLYVSDGCTSEIARYHGDTGNFRDIVVSTQPGNPVPHGLAFDPLGTLYVAYDDGHVRQFSTLSGKFLITAGTAVNPGFITIGNLNGGSDTLTPPAALSQIEVSGNVLGGASQPISGATVVAGVLVARQPSVAIGCAGLALLLEPCPNVTSNFSGSYVFFPSPTSSGLLPGDYVFTAFPPNTVPFFPGSISVTVPVTGPFDAPDIILQQPPLVPPNVNLLSGTGATLTPPTVANGVPVINSGDDLKITAPGCSGGTGQYSASLNLSNVTSVAFSSGFAGNVITSGTLTETPSQSGSFTATIPGSAFSGQRGLLNFSVLFSNCRAPGSPSVINFVIYIDPSGKVIDDSTGAPIPGATVTLLRSDTAHGTLEAVPNGSGLMSLSNRNNPDLTNTLGEFGWDVAPGYYQLQATAPGYTCDPSNPPPGFTCVNGAVQSEVFAVPPAAVGIIMPLHKSPVQFELTTSVLPDGSGTITPGSGPFPDGSIVGLQATANPGYTFVNWSGPVSDPQNPGTTVIVNGSTLVTANFTELQTTLSANITTKSGPANARMWTITLTNNGPGAANAAQITSLSFTQTFGASCTPLVNTPVPFRVGNIAPAASQAATLAIDFSSCPTNARFTVNAGLSANAGSATGTLIRYNQFE